MSVKELRKELAAWEQTLSEREKDEARRVVQAQRARRRTVRRRGKPDSAAQGTLYQRARERLAATRRAIHKAREAIGKKRHQIKQATKPKGRALALAWCKNHLYKSESPPGSNCTPWLALDFGLRCCAWCGKWCGNALVAAGVKGVSYRILAVAFIEDDARAGRLPFTGWSPDPRTAKPGDLVVLFGRGIHVEVVHAVGNGVIYSYGGNTSSGTGGSQSNGGGSYPRVRPFSVVHGIAHVHFQ